MNRRPFFRTPMRTLITNKDAFESVCVPSFTKDGLLPCSNIVIMSYSNGYELNLAKQGAIPLYSVPESDSVTDYLVDYPEIWNQAAIRVSYAPSIWGRITVFGVPFKKAVEIALQSGHMRSKYFFPDRSVEGRHETLLIQLDRTNDVRGELLQLQTWQYSPGTRRAHYLHALSYDFMTHVCHLDGATIEYSDDDLDLFLQKSRKVKGDRYEKHFRLDGMIAIEHMHGLAAAFFPTQELYREAFEVVSLETWT